MKKHVAIHALGGSYVRAAAALGCSRQAVRQWPVDPDDNITSRQVINAVLAQLVRQSYANYIGTPDVKPLKIDESTLHDLLHVPADIME